ncbi:MAG: cupin domain-containing protein [Chloroflexota bacterium]
MSDADQSASRDVAPGAQDERAARTNHVRWIGEAVEIPTRPGMFRRSFIGEDDGVSELFLEELTFHQGAAIPLHHHPIVEVFVMLEGELTFRLDDETITVGPNHTVTIPPNTPHAVINLDGRIARVFAAAPWDHRTFFRDVTTYLEGEPRD